MPSVSGSLDSIYSRQSSSTGKPINPDARSGNANVRVLRYQSTCSGTSHHSDGNTNVAFNICGLIDERYEAIKREINKAFDGKIEKVRSDSEPLAIAAAREARTNQMEAARKAEEEKIAREEAEAEEARQTAEERKRLIRQAELDAIKRRTGSTVSPIITGTKEKACADLLASNIDD